MKLYTLYWGVACVLLVSSGYGLISAMVAKINCETEQQQVYAIAQEAYLREIGDRTELAEYIRFVVDGTIPQRFYTQTISQNTIDDVIFGVLIFCTVFGGFVLLLLGVYAYNDENEKARMANQEVAQKNVATDNP